MPQENNIYDYKKSNDCSKKKLTDANVCKKVTCYSFHSEEIFIHVFVHQLRKE